MSLDLYVPAGQPHHNEHALTLGGVERARIHLADELPRFWDREVVALHARLPDGRRLYAVQWAVGAAVIPPVIAPVVWTQFRDHRAMAPEPLPIGGEHDPATLMRHLGRLLVQGDWRLRACRYDFFGASDFVSQPSGRYTGLGWARDVAQFRDWFGEDIEALSDATKAMFEKRPRVQLRAAADHSARLKAKAKNPVDVRTSTLAQQSRQRHDRMREVGRLAEHGRSGESWIELGHAMPATLPAAAAPAPGVAAEHILTLREAASLSGRNVHALRQAIRSGALRVLPKRGARRRVLVTWAALLDYLEPMSPAIERLLEPCEVIASTPDPELALALKEYQERVDARLEELASTRPRRARAVRMHYLEGRSYEECGREMGISRERVRHLSEEGLSQMRRTLLGAPTFAF